MILDRDTTFAISALITLIMGAILLIAQGNGRIGVWATTWGLGNVAFGLSNINKALTGVVPDAWRVAGENLACLIGYTMIVQGARLLAGRRAHWRTWATLVVIMAVPLALAHAPEFKPLRIAFNNSLFIACDMWVAFEAYRIARKERLDTPWIMVGLFAATVPLAWSRLSITVLTMLGMDTLEHVKSGPWTAAMLAAIWSLRVAVPALIIAERSNRALERLACRDQLTGALNRAGLDRLRGSLIGDLSVLMLDLDNFKPLNDRYGHDQGDGVLRMLAVAVEAQLKPKDALVRLGGDEFLVILPRASPVEAERMGERIRDAFADAIASLNLTGPATTISMGVATGQPDRCDFHTLLKTADEALYRAKRAGRDRIAA